VLQVADGTERELSAGARLKELLAARSTPSSSEGVAALAAAIAAAAPFPSLATDVAAARALHQQCCQRVEAAAKLQDVVEHVLQLTSSAAGVGVAASRDSGAAAAAAAGAGAVALPLQGFDSPCWERCVSMLDAAVEEAKEAHVSVLKVTAAWHCSVLGVAAGLCWMLCLPTAVAAVANTHARLMRGVQNRALCSAGI
jgi:hypothetical protein